MINAGEFELELGCAPLDLLHVDSADALHLIGGKIVCTALTQFLRKQLSHEIIGEEMSENKSSDIYVERSRCGENYQINLCLFYSRVYFFSVYKISYLVNFPQLMIAVGMLRFLAAPERRQL